VYPTGQLTEHIDRISPIARFSEDPATVYNNGCIGSEDRQSLSRTSDGKCFFPREPCHVGARRLTGKNGFIDIRARDNVRHADLRQKLTPSRRTGSQTNYGTHQSR
jgi:hypothetical protein